jgi:hypothetical protein
MREFFTFKHPLIGSQEVICARDVFTSKLKLLIERAVQRKGKTEEQSSNPHRHSASSNCDLMWDYAIHTLFISSGHNLCQKSWPLLL